MACNRHNPKGLFCSLIIWFSPKNSQLALQREPFTFHSFLDVEGNPQRALPVLSEQPVAINSLTCHGIHPTSFQRWQLVHSISAAQWLPAPPVCYPQLHPLVQRHFSWAVIYVAFLEECSLISLIFFHQCPPVGFYYLRSPCTITVRPLFSSKLGYIYQNVTVIYNTSWTSWNILALKRLRWVVL